MINDPTKTVSTFVDIHSIQVHWKGYTKFNSLAEADSKEYRKKKMSELPQLWIEIVTLRVREKEKKKGKSGIDKFGQDRTRSTDRLRLA